VRAWRAGPGRRGEGGGGGGGGPAHPVVMRLGARKPSSGASVGLTEGHYKPSSLKASLCVSAFSTRPLVFDRLQHWDLSYFATILESATANGAELKAAITRPAMSSGPCTRRNTPRAF